MTMSEFFQIVATLCTVTPLNTLIVNPGMYLCIAFSVLTPLVLKLTGTAIALHWKPIQLLRTFLAQKSWTAVQSCCTHMRTHAASMPACTYTKPAIIRQHSHSHTHSHCCIVECPHCLLVQLKPIPYSHCFIVLKNRTATAVQHKKPQFTAIVYSLQPLSHWHSTKGP